MTGWWRACWLSEFVAIVFALSWSGAAWADEPGSPPSPAACPGGNLLIGARASGPLSNDRLGLLVDGRVAPEGAVWPGPHVVVPLHGELIFDLGAPIRARRFFYQSDADQPALITVSPDGSASATVSIPAHPTASGMISRVVDLPPGPVRYLRLAATDATRVLALTELGLHCDASHDMSRDVRVVADRDARRPGGNGDTTPHDLSKLAIVAIGLAAVMAAARGVRVPALVFTVLATAGFAAYVEFGAYHDGRFVHDHDVFHYFVGAKYFPELGYDRLYACSSVAEADAGFPQRAGLRPARDLATNRVVGGSEVLQRAAECHRAFSEQRFRDFVHDVRVFANVAGVEVWNRALMDHGFNASPAWIVPGRAVARLLRASSPWAIGRGESPFDGIVPALDPVLLVLAFAAALWAFGALPACLAAVVFGCNPMSEFSWIGGGFLRQLWFAMLVIAVALLHRRKWVSGGIALGLASVLQLFPAVCVAGLALAAIAARYRERRVDPGTRRALAAAIATIALVVPLSTWGSGRPDAWRAFAANTVKHAATPSANLVGLPAALSFRMDTRANVLFDASAVDAHERVRQARIENYRRVRPLHYFAVALGLWLLVRRALRTRLEPWEATTLALALVPLSVDLSSYYTEYLAVLALLGHRTPRLWLAVLATVAGVLAGKLLVGYAEPDLGFAVASWSLVAGALAALLVVQPAGPVTPPVELSPG